MTVWDARTGRQLAKREGPGLGFNQSVVSADGRRLAQSSVELDTRAVRVTVWDRDKPAPVLMLDVGDADPVPKDKWRVANAIALSPDGRRLAVALKDGTVQLWDVDSGREALATRQHGSELGSLSFSEDGRCLAGIGIDGHITLFTAAPEAP
jgi:WD40 repeat protein